jgi:RNA polymerase sigma-70 factor, ECF subfamily
MATTSLSEQTNTSDANRTSHSLIVQAKAREPAAWERLVKLYSPLVYFWCQESGLPPSDVHDVFRDVFHALARDISKFHPTENGTFRGWLRTMARNKVNDHFRRIGPRAGCVRRYRCIELLRANSGRHTRAFNL